MKIEFVSDVSCPWCAVGLHSLEAALERLAGEVSVEMRFQPFELNPGMPAEGQDIVEHLGAKYGVTPAQIEQSQAVLRERGRAVGFEFGERRRIWNTFDAHRLLCWAGREAGAERQRALKHALLKAYLGDGENPSDHEVLLRAARSSGLDVARALQVLESDEYANVVRAKERFYAEQGIHAVPSVIVDDRHLIQGGQPVEVFEQTLRQLAAQGARAS